MNVKKRRLYSNIAMYLKSSGYDKFRECFFLNVNGINWGGGRERKRERER